MRSAEQLLEIIGNISENNPDYVFHRVYRHLFNDDLILRAYLKLAPNEGNMSRGSDGSTIDGFGTKDIRSIIDDLKNERFYPKPARREYIPKANGKLRPLGIPTFRDKVVQEALKELLEAIYEPLFSDSSHGFRPGRGCHTALGYIQMHCHDTTWVIEGDLTAFFDNIDHDILLGIISKKVQDGRVIELIRRFLKAGYMEDNSFKESELGSPQGGVLSPLLANIYLNEFDKYVESLKAEYTKGDKRRRNPEYSRRAARRRRAVLSNKPKEAKEALKAMHSIPSGDPMDPDYVRLQYVRYADDWCIFVTGNKELTLEIKSKVAEYLSGTLKLQLNETKTHVTNLSNEKIRFLGFEIAKNTNSTRMISKGGVPTRYLDGKISLLMPKDIVDDKKRQISHNGKPCRRTDLINYDVDSIMRLYAYEINGIYNYYCIATNVSGRMNELNFFMKYSMVRTIADKMKTSVKKVFKEYGQPVLLEDGTIRMALCV